MPSYVRVLSSDEKKENLSDEALSAFDETGSKVVTSVFSGRATAEREGRHLLLITGMDDGIDAQLDAIILEPNPRARRLGREQATVAETLSADEVQRMLGDESDWRLAVAGPTTNVLTKGALAKAWAAPTDGTVELQLRRPNADEEAALDAAKESLTPKAGAALLKGALAAPVTNIALVATASGLFLGWTEADDKDLVSVAAVIAAVCALAAVSLSLIGGGLLRKSTVRLSRLDLLLNRSPGPPTWMVNGATALLVAALVAAVVAVFTAPSSAETNASFLKPTTATAPDDAKKVTFSVDWQHLGAEAEAVTTTASTPGQDPQTEKTFKTGEDKTSQEFEFTLQPPADIRVVSEAQGSDGKQVGDGATHTYAVE